MASSFGTGIIADSTFTGSSKNEAGTCPNSTCVGSESETVPFVALGKLWSSEEAWLSALQAGKYLDARENACRAQQIYLHANSQRTGEMSRYIQ